ncbi:hypothetical protein SAMN05421754_100337 [Nitrosomonas sp. Nm58]|nr:hypothetical protein SAMN05421754_100337 [Nitrosomonas sp. Nm58]
MIFGLVRQTFAADCGIRNLIEQIRVSYPEFDCGLLRNDDRLQEHLDESLPFGNAPAVAGDLLPESRLDRGNDADSPGMG